MNWRPRGSIRPQRRRGDGRSVWGFGLRAGYWPCLRAPFLRLDFGPIIAEAWLGLPSYDSWARS